MKPVALKKKFLIFTILVASLLAFKCDNTSAINNTLGNNEGENSRIHDIAKKITVRVSGDRSSGSGVIIARQEKTIQSQKVYSYLVLTSLHNLASKGSTNKDFHIFTPDGSAYPATLMSPQSIKLFPKEDLAVVYFQSHQQAPYEVATKLQESTVPLSQDNEMTIAGFPCEGEDCRNISPLTPTKGKAYLIEKPLEQGYQIGFEPGDIKQGTSGGPALNSRGELVGIIGRRMANETVSNSSYIFADGTKPLPPKIEQFRRSAWAIPLGKIKFDSIEKLLKDFPISDNTVQFVINAEDKKKERQIEEHNKNILEASRNNERISQHTQFVVYFGAFILLLILILVARLLIILDPQYKRKK